MAQETQTGPLYQRRVVGRRGRREGVSKGGDTIHVYLWLIHAEVYLKTTHFCKALILHLKNK